MSEELLFAFKGNSDIQALMNAFHSSFHEKTRGGRVTKYVFEPGKKYLLVARRVPSVGTPVEGRARYDTVAIFLQQDGTAWKVKITAEIDWNEHGSFFTGEETLLDEAKRFFIEKCEGLIQVTRTWASPLAEDQEEQSHESEVMPFESEISEEGTLARCPRCGSIEIIFPNVHTCTQCGADIIYENRYSTPSELEERFSPNHVSVQAKAALVGKCVVCGLGIYQGEPILACPHCSGKAHRTHLLEYIHVKGQCPSCGAHLSEEVLATDLAVGEGVGNLEKPRKRIKKKPPSSGVNRRHYPP
jgi:hypothetical protein